MQKTKTQISFAVTAKLISAFVLATRIVQSLYFLNRKFQASSYLQPKRPVKAPDTDAHFPLSFTFEQYISGRKRGAKGYVGPEFGYFVSTARFVSHLVGNPEDRFSHNEAQIKYM